MKLEDKRREEKTELLQLVGFKIDSEEFAINILIVQEIIKLLKITKVPNAPNFVEGVVNIRGRIIPIINLRSIIQLPQKEFDNKTRIIVVEIANNTVGFIVDAVTEVLRIPLEITEAPPELTTDINSDFINSVAKIDDRILLLLDIDKIISHSYSEQLA